MRVYVKVEDYRGGFEELTFCTQVYCTLPDVHLLAARER